MLQRIFKVFVCLATLITFTAPVHADEVVNCTEDAECDSLNNEVCVGNVCISETSTNSKKTDPQKKDKKESSDTSVVPKSGTTSGDATGALPQQGKDVYISAEETELTSPIGEIDLLNLIGGRIIPAILGFVGVLAVLAVIYGGITYMISFGNEQKMETGKKILTYAVLGILAIAASYMIINTIISLTTSQ